MRDISFFFFSIISLNSVYQVNVFGNAYTSIFRILNFNLIKLPISVISSLSLVIILADKILRKIGEGKPLYNLVGLL